MPAQTTSIQTNRVSARELRRLPAAERDSILAAVAQQAESEYRASGELTGFEAFGKDDLHGESAGTKAR